MTNLMTKLAKKATVQLKLKNTNDEGILFAQVAYTNAQKEKGLRGIASLGSNEGMLFIYDTPQELSFWMQGVEIPKLAIAFLDSQLQVVGIAEMNNEESTRMHHSDKIAQYAIEALPSFFEKYNIEIGDQFILEDK